MTNFAILRFASVAGSELRAREKEFCVKRIITISALLLAAALFGSCGLFVTLGDGTLTTEARTVEGSFSAISLSGTIDIDVVYGELPSVSVYVDSNLQDKVSVELQGTVLTISEPSFPSLWPSTGAKVTVTMPAVSTLTLIGTGDLLLSGFADTESLAVSLTGTGNATLSGFASSLDVDLTGTGNLSAWENFSCTDADINSTGTGNISLKATGAVNGIMTGTGNLDVYGGATVNVSNTGTGIVRQH